MVSWEAMRMQNVHESLMRDERRPKRNRNPRYRCKGCTGRTTRNQLRKSSGNCIYCGTPIPHGDWK